MTDDILSQVKLAEETAAKELDAAKDQARELIEEAKNQTNLAYKDEIAKAKKKAEEILADAKKEAEKKREPVIAKARDESKKILDVDKAKVEATINTLVERIVNNGNS